MDRLVLTLARPRECAFAQVPRQRAPRLCRSAGAGTAGVRRAAAARASTGVAFAGTLESAYRACLWSRIANRVFLEVAHFEARDADEFHAAVRRIDWAASPGSRDYAGVRFQRAAPGDYSHSLRGAEAQGRHCRCAAPRHRHAARRGARAPGSPGARACTRHRHHRVHRPLG